MGYIPGVKVKKAIDALEKQEIKTVTFKTIEWKFIYGLSEFRYVSSIVVTNLPLIKIISTMISCSKYCYLFIIYFNFCLRYHIVGLMVIVVSARLKSVRTSPYTSFKEKGGVEKHGTFCGFNLLFHW